MSYRDGVRTDMMSTDVGKLRKVVDELVEDALRELADEAYQRQLWLAAGGPEVSSFTECISRLWDDSGLSDALDRPQGVYTPEIDDQLRKLSTLLDGIDDLQAPQTILQDPRLGRARMMASALLLDLRHFDSYEDRTEAEPSPPRHR